MPYICLGQIKLEDNPSQNMNFPKNNFKVKMPYICLGQIKLEDNPSQNMNFQKNNFKVKTNANTQSPMFPWGDVGWWEGLQGQVH